jgi:hypothetical protein
MSNAGVSAWTAIIKKLQQLIDASDPASTVAATKALNASLNSLETDQQLPHAALKKLVQDVQVSWGMHGLPLFTFSGAAWCRTPAGQLQHNTTAVLHRWHVAVTEQACLLGHQC